MGGIHNIMIDMVVSYHKTTTTLYITNGSCISSRKVLKENVIKTMTKTVLSHGSPDEQCALDKMRVPLWKFAPWLMNP